MKLGSDEFSSRNTSTGSKMKNTGYVALALLIGSIAHAEPIKLRNGTTLDGKFENYKPATVEIVTGKGRMQVRVADLDKATVQKLLPNSSEAVAYDLVDEAAKEIAKDAKALVEGLKELPTEIASDKPNRDFPKVKSTVIASVPPDVVTKIKADAAKQWPGDFQMQEYVIKTQIEAYKKVQAR
jgi:hypothetical protein